MVTFSRSVWKKLHRAEKIYTGSARGARNNYEVWQGLHNCGVNRNRDCFQSNVIASLGKQNRLSDKDPKVLAADISDFLSGWTTSTNFELKTASRPKC